MRVVVVDGVGGTSLDMLGCEIKIFHLRQPLAVDCRNSSPFKFFAGVETRSCNLIGQRNGHATSHFDYVELLLI